MKVKLFGTVQEMMNPAKARTEELIRVEVNIAGNVYEIHERNGQLVILTDGRLIVYPVANNTVQLDLV